ncbi:MULTISPECIES: 2-C-methyl-D-erythritol 4-phosphate cytidylyltransferase [unclassified Mucilaginibacter]|uniref:2-C-methyl-D-erythritol 4-phosphate cytidylyltransferase n=1 Tax=unclassified Mucilaginibacter TaxID=2617802 RepID=UPI002AC91088|nr:MULTISPECIES: 2-C-methyl-D-erythritol 4-phosphate cytidylyltransferase [unclassified Mucilaginibacter]MEB0261536.1 2-C-methyl-D-erythritol 4-phosphate cytidylyltransferase [Mucilaginibacter sp. 10I4]MEB0277827.1 2-C-methyl-D-erythritol 4-phosphate cytidylyltransferase [Mucilaginibacter sp. 10B2]MEB0300626.1 2-C-methyl-D-erythritol 4-phosphate cytidylyltransferase [Mucilaginibacter sp. 5C4]WPX22720.1 2-C-methyl-D-erythritol 4-phosphate cytidylyltransferase [Mucilaginibacter sp. 5C4]
MPGLNSHISYLKSTYAVIVAGGSGSRMQSVLPKQFIELCGEPVLMHTIRAFQQSNSSPKIILALHAGYHGLWAELCNKHNFTIPHTVITGGETRFHSVKNAIDTIDGKDALIALHDAVRPLVSAAIIDEAYQCAFKDGTAVTAVKSRDSIRQVVDRRSTSLNRDNIYLVQTPQTFQLALLKKAYEQPYTDNFTDDASVVEKSGVAITLIEGSYSNIKITFPEDITIAEALINKKATIR